MGEALYDWMLEDVEDPGWNSRLALVRETAVSGHPIDLVACLHRVVLAAVERDGGSVELFTKAGIAFRELARSLDGGTDCGYAARDSLRYSLEFYSETGLRFNYDGLSQGEIMEYLRDLDSDISLEELRISVNS